MKRSINIRGFISNNLFLRYFVLPSFALLLFIQGAKAQSQFATITGLVVDPSGRSIAGADVIITNQQTGVQTTTTTNVDGNYTAASLIPGIYSLKTSKTGFSSITNPDIRLNLGQIARVDIHLPIGKTSQQITVNASGLLLQTESASIGTVVPHSGVVNLPLNGRNYLQVATLVPGVNPAGLGGSGDGMPANNLNINGSRASATSYVIDGADVTNQYQEGTEFTPAPDAIQEFRVETNNMTAQYGGGGAIVSVALKSGTNNFHGNLYEFLRNNAMDARNYFAKTSPELRQNQFGGTLGGPILKNKLFFFSDYQGTRIRQGITYNTIVPTSDEQAGNFSGLPQIHDPYTGVPLTDNTIPTGDLSSQATYFLKYFPLPNTPGGTYLTTLSGSTNLDQYDIRIDGQLSNADRLAFTFSHQWGNSYTPGPFPLNGAATGSSTGTITSVGWTHVFSPTLINEAHFSYVQEAGRQNDQGIGGVNDVVQSGIGGFAQTSTENPGPPTLSISGFGGINGGTFRPIYDPTHNYNISDVLTKVVGRHTIMIGGDARWAVSQGQNGAYSRGVFDFTGVYTGNSFADFLYGVPFQGQRSFPRDPYGANQQNQDLFIQDTWKATSQLTLIGGVRWDLIHPNTYLHNTYASTNPVTNQIIVASNSQGQINTTAQKVTALVLPIFQSRIVPSSSVGLPASLQYMDWHGFAPRLGIAYQLPSNLVIRAGYGIFYPLPNLNQTSAIGLINPPFLVDELSNFNTTPVPTATLANLFPETSAGNYQLTAVSFNQVNPHQPNQTIQEYNVAIQKSIGQMLSLQVAYVGSKGSNLAFISPNNIPTPGPGDIQSRRGNTFFSSGTYFTHSGISNYNSLQLTAETQSWKGLFFLGSYTWGKALDNQDNDNISSSPVQDPANLKAEYGIASYNLASRLTLASTYKLPFFANAKPLVKNTLGGWTMSNIITLQSGQVFTPTIGTDPANTGTPMRPNRIGSGKLAHPTINDWFDATAFAVPQLYTYGNSGRNILTGPGLKNWDFALFKTFSLSHLMENSSLQFRGEFFNFTNTPPFGLPQTNIQSAAAGRVLSAGSPREIQVSLKAFF